MIRLGLRNILKRSQFSSYILEINSIKYENSRHLLNISTNNLSQFCRHITKTVHHVSEDINKKQSEEYLVKLRNDPDTFGSAGTNKQEVDDGDLKEQEYLENPPSVKQKLTTKQYADIIKDLIRKKKIKEAVDVLEVRMIKEDRVKPEGYIFNLILGACGRVGYTKKAFSLYNKMKQRGLQITGGTYTALFNACANSPWIEDGLSRAKHLREIIVEKRYEPNDTNYNSMIKAFGRCGDLTTAFSLVDEMVQKKINVKDDTLNFLLQACISDKEAGFRHSLLVWRKFIDKCITPNIYSYNLLLKSVKECNLGDLEATRDVITQILTKRKNLPDNIISLVQNIFQENNMKLLESEDLAIDAKSKNNATQTKEQYLNFDLKSQTENTVLPNVEQTNKLNTIEEPLNILDRAVNQKSISTNKKQIQQESLVENRPNLISKNAHLGNILSLSEVTKPEDRLILIGGCSGFLKNMTENHCTPDIKTFTLLLDSIPSTLAAEKELIVAMKKHNVKPDIDFYNMLIKKRNMRLDHESAQEVLNIIKKSRMMPNLVTYGVLALGCANKEDAEKLLNEMCNAKYRLNSEILGAMLQNGCYHNNFSYVLEIMEICLREDIRPNMIFMRHLEEFKKKCKNMSNDNDNGLGRTKSFQKGYEIFKMRYKTWKQEVDPITKDEVHPWQQFRQNTETDVKHYKDNERTSRFKPRHISFFRKKQGSNIDKDISEKDSKKQQRKRYVPTRIGAN